MPFCNILPLLKAALVWTFLLLCQTSRRCLGYCTTICGICFTFIRTYFQSCYLYCEKLKIHFVSTSSRQVSHGVPVVMLLSCSASINSTAIFCVLPIRRNYPIPSLEQAALHRWTSGGTGFVNRRFHEIYFENVDFFKKNFATRSKCEDHKLC